jgi:hypothetical protein
MYRISQQVQNLGVYLMRLWCQTNIWKEVTPITLHVNDSNMNITTAAAAATTTITTTTDNKNSWKQP